MNHQEKPNTYFRTAILLVMFMTAQSTGYCQSLSMSTEFQATIKRISTSKSLNPKIKKTARVLKLKPKILSSIAFETLGYFALSPESQLTYLDQVGILATKSDFIDQSDVNLLKELQQNITSKDFVKFKSNILQLLSSKNKSPYNSAMCDFLNSVAQSEGYNGMTDFYNGIVPPDIIDPNDIIDSFGIPSQSDLEKGIARGLSMADGFSTSSRFDNIGVLSATAQASTADNDHEFADSLLKTTMGVLGALFGGTVAFVVMAPTAAGTAGATTPAVVGATIGGASLGFNIGMQVGDTITEGYNTSSGNFMDPCHPNQIEDCIPGLGLSGRK